MGLAQDLAAAKEAPRTGIEAWIDTLTEEDRTVLTQAAPDRGITHTAFHAILKANGARVGKDAVTQWRRANGFTG